MRGVGVILYIVFNIQYMKYVKSFFIGILVYILGFVFLFFGMVYRLAGIDKSRGEYENIAWVIMLCLPFIMVFSKSLKTGFGYLVASLVIANAVFPAIDWSSGSPTPKFGKMGLKPKQFAWESSNDSAEPCTISGTDENRSFYETTSR